MYTFYNVTDYTYNSSVFIINSLDVNHCTNIYCHAPHLFSFFESPLGPHKPLDFFVSSHLASPQSEIIAVLFHVTSEKIWVKIRETAINNSFFSIGWHRVTTATILSLSKQFFVRTERSLTICAASLSSTIITCNRLKLKKFKPLKIGLFLPVYGISSQYFAKMKYLVDQISKKLNL